VLRGLPAEAGFALEIAAQLGARVDEGEWREACEQAKLQPPTALVERLLQQGLARDIERGWAFVHGMLSESITRIAGEQRRLEDARGAAGAALAERGADRWRREELRAAEDLLSRADRALRAEAHGALWAGRVRPLLSAARWKLGQPEAAVAGLEEALERAMALELVGAEALLLNNLGNIHRLQGRFQQALGCYQRCRSLAAAAGDRRLEIGVLSGLGSLYSRTLEHQQALNCYQEMLALAEGLGDSRLLRLALSGLGTTLGDSGDHRRALECFERELALFTPDDGHLAPAVVLGNLGTACLELGRLAEARGHLERSLALHREATNTRSVGVTLRNLGQLCLAEGAPEEARDLLLKALASSEALGLQRDQARDHHHLGRAALALGEPAMARLHITRAVELYTAIELPECAAESRALLA
jgi:tetratricopeptide (TPR) repeat protein